MIRLGLGFSFISENERRFGPLYLLTINKEIGAHVAGLSKAILFFSGTVKPKIILINHIVASLSEL